MRTLIITLLFAGLSVTSYLVEASSVKSRVPNIVGEHGIHLFFNEKEFVDVLTFSVGPNDKVIGHMDVPNDFEGSIDNLKIDGNCIEFDLFVPKNAARPKDLIFHYKAHFFDDSKSQMIGFVTLKGEADFVASFTGFKRN